MKKLPDDIACRRHLIRQRNYLKENIKHITFSVSIFAISNRMLSSITYVTYNIKTDTFSLAYDFIYKNKRMLSTSKPKVKCNTEAGRRLLQEQRKASKEWNANTRTKVKNNYNHSTTSFDRKEVNKQERK